MDELERCFVCLVTIRQGYGVGAMRRSGVPVWIDDVVCFPCGNRIAEVGEVVVERWDEHWTVRRGSVVKDVEREFGRQRAS